MEEVLPINNAQTTTTLRQIHVQRRRLLAQGLVAMALVISTQEHRLQPVSTEILQPVVLLEEEVLRLFTGVYAALTALLVFTGYLERSVIHAARKPVLLVL